MIEINEQEMTELQKELEIQLRQDFIDDCSQKLDLISGLLDNIAEGKTKNVRGNLLTCIGEIHSIKGMGMSFGFPGITAVAHRMEDFLLKRDSMDVNSIREAFVFVDTINRFMTVETQPSHDEISKIVRELPTVQSAEITAERPKDIEVLSIMPKSVQQRVINEELESCGFRVTSLHSSFEALSIALSTRPDLLVISAVVDMISGIELANMIRALNAMGNTPIIIVTSFDERVLPDEELPRLAAIARKGPNFVDDLSACLIELNVLAI